ncbi:MAG: enoyl-CoA hydratase-related protein [Hyphomonas sp.]
MSKTVRIERRGPVFTVTLDRPDRLNAISPELIADLSDALDECAGDPDLRVLVLTGAGRGFCAGADLVPSASGERKSLREQKLQHRKGMDEGFNGLVRRLRNMPAPTLAAVNGVAAGGGCGLALSCDVVIAADTARFILVFVPQLGLIPDMGATWHFPRAMGRARSLGRAFFGEPISAEEAAEMGLIWKQVPQSEFPEVIEETAQTLARGPTRAYVATRHAMDMATMNTLPQQLDLEAEIQPELLVSEDFREGVKAFLEKRKPDFSGN